MPIMITTPAPSSAKPNSESKPLCSPVSASQQRFLSVALNGSKAVEPAGVLAGN